MDNTGGYADYGFVAEFYDHVVPYRERQDVAFFVQAARESGGPVLEIGCDTGRVLIPTARAGFEIMGLDLSPHMLAVCRERLRAEPPDVQARAQLVEDDMRAFALNRLFALATVPFRPFQHLTTVADQMACLGAIRRHLRPGGRLILDLFNPSLPALTADNIGQEYGDEPEFSLPDGRRVLRRFRTTSRDLFAQINHVEMLYYVAHPDGRRECLVHAFPMRYLYRYEVEHLLARCGFALETVYADYDGSPYGRQYPGELICLARRTEA
ncbi:MAG: class I SAM-dependent methyltransferase [Chloroflexota bacterium]